MITCVLLYGRENFIKLFVIIISRSAYSTMSFVLKPLYTLSLKPSVTTLQTIASQEEGH